MPALGVTYQIKPSKIFYVIVGYYTPRDATKSAELKVQPSTCRIGFGELATDNVALVHDGRGRLEISMLAAKEWD